MKSEIKHLLLGLFLGSFLHFGAREAVRYAQAKRYWHCRVTGTRKVCKELIRQIPWWQKMIVFELKWISGDNSKQ